MYRITSFPLAELTTGSRQEKQTIAPRATNGTLSEVKTFEEVINLAANNTISLNEYTDNKRSGSKFLRTNLIGLDIDDNLTLTETKNKLNDLGWRYGIYTSFNHLKNGVDKFRVVLELNEHVTDEATYKATWSSIHSQFHGVDRQCSDIARFYFHSNPETQQIFVSDGMLVPVVDAFIPKVKNKTELRSGNGRLSLVIDNDGWEGVVRRNRLPEPVRKWISGIDDYGQPYIPAPGERSGNLYKFAHLCKERNYSFDWCIENLGRPLRDDPDYVSEYGGPREVEKKIISTIKQVFSSESRHGQPELYSDTMLSDPEMFVENWIRSHGFTVNRNGMFVTPNGEMSPKVISTKVRLDYSNAFNEFRRKQRDLPTKEKKVAYKVDRVILNDAVTNFVQTHRDNHLIQLQERLKHRPEEKDCTEMEKFCRALIGQNDPVVVAVLKHFIWQVKRKVFDLPVTYHMMPIVIGPQGNGKSTAIREKLLAPLNEFIMTPKMQHFHDEKHFEGFQNNFVSFCDEMAGCERADIDGIKEWITKDEQTGREMYSTSQVRYKQNCTAIGCSNRSVQTLLYDPTGLRRFFEIAADPDMEKNGGWTAYETIDFSKLWRSVDENRDEVYISDYFDEIEIRQEAMRMEDPIELFLKETDAMPTEDCEFTQVPVAKLYNDYREFVFTHGLKRRPSNWFGAKLREYGIGKKRIRDNDSRYFVYLVAHSYRPFN